jgi:hypothetical protein
MKKQWEASCRKRNWLLPGQRDAPDRIWRGWVYEQRLLCWEWWPARNYCIEGLGSWKAGKGQGSYWPREEEGQHFHCSCKDRDEVCYIQPGYWGQAQDSPVESGRSWIAADRWFLLRSIAAEIGERMVFQAAQGPIGLQHLGIYSAVRDACGVTSTAALWFQGASMG